MIEAIVVIALLVILPYLFQKWITSAYYNQDKLFFGDQYEQDTSINVGSEEDAKEYVANGEQK